MFSFVLGFMCVHIISSIIHRVYKHEILMRQLGLVVFPFGCVLSCWVVPWVFCGLVGPGPAAASAGTGRAAAAPASGCLLVWRLGGAGAPPATFADARQPNRGLDLEHAPARPELPYAVAICTGTRACCPLPRPEGLHCRGSGECRRPRPMATAACWSATELRLALALGHIRAPGTRGSLHRTCLSTRCICERDLPRNRSRTSPQRRGQAQDSDIQST
jgi:hypothetical protein